jgi:putative endonuclease
MLPAVRPKDRVWRDGERAAWEAYRARGYRLVARNWRSSLGELDLVVARGDVLVFCEVKARSTTARGGPYDAVTEVKQHKLRLLAEAFLATARPRAGAFRFDVASVRWNVRGQPDVYLFEDAF